MPSYKFEYYFIVVGVCSNREPNGAVKKQSSRFSSLSLSLRYTRTQTRIYMYIQKSSMGVPTAEPEIMTFLKGNESVIEFKFL